MAWDTKALKAVLGVLAPQHYNVTADDWEPTHGENGAVNTNIKASVLPAGASTEATLNAVKTAVENTLNVALPAGASTEATLSAMKARADLLATEITLDAIKTILGTVSKETTLGAIQTAVQNTLAVKVMESIVSGTAIGNDTAIMFANSAPVNSQVIVDIAKPTNTKGRYVLAVHNPSTVTDLTVKVFSAEPTLNGATRYALITIISVPKLSNITGTAIDTHLNIIEGLFVGTGIRMVVSNDTVLGSAEGFSAYSRLKEV